MILESLLTSPKWNFYLSNVFYDGEPGVQQIETALFWKCDTEALSPFSGSVVDVIVLVGWVSKFDILCISSKSAECVILASSSFVPALLHAAVVEKQLSMYSFSLYTVWRRELELVLGVLFV